MENKLYKKLESLIRDSRIEFWNGHQIKKCIVGDGYKTKPFQINGVKYKLEITVSSKCDHNTDFIPVLCDLEVVDLRIGKIYKNENISNFLNIPFEDIKILLQPMIEKTYYTSNEIEQVIIDFQDFVKSFRKNFCLD